MSHLTHYKALLGLACLSISIPLSAALPGYIEAVLKRNQQVQRAASTPIQSRHVSKTNGTLEQVSVVFRHGDRVPDQFSIYPNSPHKTTSFYPYNLGDLTYEGQQRMYYVGLNLRKRYNDLLGDRYFTNLVESISSSYSRCQMSMQSLHVGLFGKSKELPFKKFHWQAVLYSIIPAKEDNLISVFLTCPEIFEDIKHPDKSTYPNLENVFEAVRLYSGYPEPITFSHILLVYDCLKVSLENGFAVPKEFAPFYPDSFREAAMIDWLYAAKSVSQLIGPLIKRITVNALTKSTKTLAPEDRKMFLYAGHDLNVIMILVALNIDWNMEEINYGAHILFELHNINGIYGFKVYLQNSYPEPRLLEIPECGTFCPLNWFDELSEKLMNKSLKCS